MNRLQKKCLVASFAMHGLLLLILLVGPAFRSSKKSAVDLPLLEVIPFKTIEAALSRGGNPDAKPPPPAASVQQIQQPPAQQPQPQPEAVRPKAPVESKPPPELKKPKPEPTPVIVRTEAPTLPVEKPKPQIKISEKITTRTPKELAEDKAKREKEEARVHERELASNRQRAAQQIESRLNGAFRSLSTNLSSSTKIEVLGPRGEEFANYGQVVISIYNRNWMKPAGMEETVVVKTTVIIARDGKVVSTRITDRSGNPAVDKSVDQVLDRVKFIAPFPEGARDETRTFNIDFELKPNRLTG